MSAAGGPGRTVTVWGVGLLCGALPACTPGSPAGTTQPWPEPTLTSAVVEKPAPGSPLTGATVVIDAGHQLGNSRFPRQTARQVPAGGFTKPCNSTGTSTDAGFPESTFNFRVAQRLRRQLERRGARVIMTRARNSLELWGPCVDERGRRGNRIGADVKLSIHGDGSYTEGRGFHLIAPTDRAPWTHDIYRSSGRLAAALKRAFVHTGFSPADYVAGADGLDVRADLATLNLSDVPTVVVESGNMRNAADARVMSSRKGQHRYARALRRGIRDFLGG